jgi:Uncharacterized conserved protein
VESIHPSARIADLLGLLMVLNNTFEGRADLYELEKEMEVDLDDLMPIVYLTNNLGFVTIGKGDIIITDKGIEFLKSNIRKRKELIRESLIKVEPFVTAKELREFDIETLYFALLRKGVKDYTSPEGMQLLEIIINEWGVYSGLITRKGGKYVVKDYQGF